MGSTALILREKIRSSLSRPFKLPGCLYGASRIAASFIIVSGNYGRCKAEIDQAKNGT